MSDNYILPAELAMLFAVWYTPPLLISFVVQHSIFKRSGVWRSSRITALCAIFSTLVLSPVVGFIALTIPLPIPNWLGVSENMWVLPLAFIIVFLVTVLSVKVATSYVHKSA